jgi:hypothetical protein
VHGDTGVAAPHGDVVQRDVPDRTHQGDAVGGPITGTLHVHPADVDAVDPLRGRRVEVLAHRDRGSPVAAVLARIGGRRAQAQVADPHIRSDDVQHRMAAGAGRLQPGAGRAAAGGGGLRTPHGPAGANGQPVGDQVAAGR